jgi:hypothetical protein
MLIDPLLSTFFTRAGSATIMGSGNRRVPCSTSTSSRKEASTRLLWLVRWFWCGTLAERVHSQRVCRWQPRCCWCAAEDNTVLAIQATVFSPVINSILFLLLPLYYLEWTE